MGPLRVINEKGGIMRVELECTVFFIGYDWNFG